MSYRRLLYFSQFSSNWWSRSFRRLCYHWSCSWSSTICSDGQHSFIGAGANVRKNVPPYIKAARDPLTFAGVNSVGLRRRGFSNESVSQIEDIYRNIYTRGLNVSNAVKVIEQEAPKSKEKESILKFIEESTKGIIRGPLN